jgi:hypothetical protein
MQIGYSEETLRMSVCKQFADIESEFNWMIHYFHQKDWDCVEDCVKNIQDSLRAISENVENLKGEIL